MAKFTLKEYMRQIESAYKTAAAKIIEINETLEALTRERVEINGSRLLTAEGKRVKLAELNEKIREAKEQIDDLRSEAANKALEIRQKVENDFFGLYHVNPADVDPQMMTVINSGIASDAELLKMAETAKPTMRRLIGQKLSESKNDKNAAMGRVMVLAVADPHLDAIDGLRGIGNYATGGGVSGPAGAREFLERWDELTGPIFAAAPNVGYAIASSGARQYFEGDGGEGDE